MRFGLKGKRTHARQHARSHASTHARRIFRVRMCLNMCVCAWRVSRNARRLCIYCMLIVRVRVSVCVRLTYFMWSSYAHTHSHIRTHTHICARTPPIRGITTECIMPRRHQRSEFAYARLPGHIFVWFCFLCCLLDAPVAGAATPHDACGVNIGTLIPHVRGRQQGGGVNDRHMRTCESVCGEHGPLFPFYQYSGRHTAYAITRTHPALRCRVWICICGRCVPVCVQT